MTIQTYLFGGDLGLLVNILITFDVMMFMINIILTIYFFIRSLLPA